MNRILNVVIIFYLNKLSHQKFQQMFDCSLFQILRKKNKINLSFTFIKNKDKNLKYISKTIAIVKSICMLTIKISFLKNANPFTKKKESKYEMKSTAIRNNFLFQWIFKNNIPTKIINIIINSINKK